MVWELQPWAVHSLRALGAPIIDEVREAIRSVKIESDFTPILQLIQCDIAPVLGSSALSIAQNAQPLESVPICRK